MKAYISNDYTHISSKPFLEKSIEVEVSDEEWEELLNINILNIQERINKILKDNFWEDYNIIE